MPQPLAAPFAAVALMAGASVLAGQVAPAIPPAPAPPVGGADEPHADVHDGRELPGVAERTEGLERREGLLTIHLDRRAGTAWLELPPPGATDGEIGRYLYVESLRTGLGSNPVGLDRGQLGPSRLVRLRRLGPRVLLEQLNLRFRAVSPEPAERRAVAESFATSVLWGAEIAALDSDGRALVDLGSLAVRDAHRTAARLKQSGQGVFALDPTRSVFDPEALLVFPDNVELEALLTFASDEPGPLVMATAPTGEAITLVQHHSIVRLPDDGYRPRRFDPRASSFAVEFADYAAPLDEPLETRWIARHRLQKADPSLPRSRVRTPIVYYVDRGAPEPVRSALVEGAGWWAEAFERAGFVDGYRVELLPDGAHPLDVRYNVIQWVHRSTRGWSYGGSVIDPRTGEIVKGHVTLGSLRVRQDRLIFEGLAGVEATGTGRPDDPVELSLARLRQLAAHEVGHTLGFSHNFAASTYGGRASVMDYPAPLVMVSDDGELDFSRAYGVGVGAWDVHAVRYAYAEAGPGEREAALLESILREGRERGLVFLSDADARPAGSAHPLAHLWDNGADPVGALRETLAVRRVALDRFGERNLATGRPVALLQEVFVPVYLHHRHQVEATSKLIGGVDYRYAVRGERDVTARPVAAERQRAALAALAECLDPATLRVPARIADLLLPRPFGYDDGGELLPGAAAPGFDPSAAAAVAADLVIGLLLEPHRAARLLDQPAQDPELPGLEEVVGRLGALVSDGAAEEDAAAGPVRRAVWQVAVERLIALAENEQAAPGVRDVVDHALRNLATTLGDRDDDPHRLGLAAAIRRHLDRQVAGPRRPLRLDDPPPGSPIGVWSQGAGHWGACGCGGSSQPSAISDQ